jgi:hypothetical protein
MSVLIFFSDLQLGHLSNYLFLEYLTICVVVHISVVFSTCFDYHILLHVITLTVSDEDSKI